MKSNMKRLNFWLNIGLSTLNYVLVIILAMICSNAFWWLFNPIQTTPYANTSPLKEFDNSIKYVTNRAPFGVIVVEKPKVEIVSDNIKLTGIYLNTVQNSIAFLEVNKKPTIVKVGEEIIPGTKLVAIENNKIVINSGNSDQDLPLQKNDTNNGINIVPTQPMNNNNIPPTTTFPNSNRNNDNQMDQENNPSAEELLNRRKQIINEIMNNESHNN